ncbi:MAG: hypothetical protein M3T56_12785 [Chloroflexota bacterium]|nr:hypothetical protein [Chloroflexota bacterium]
MRGDGPLELSPNNFLGKALPLPCALRPYRRRLAVPRSPASPDALKGACRDELDKTDVGGLTANAEPANKVARTDLSLVAEKVRNYRLDI